MKFAKRRGSVLDGAFIAGTLIAVIFGIWFLFYINSQLATVPAFANSAVVQAGVVAPLTAQTNFFDEIVIFATFCMATASVLLAFAYRQHPAFFIGSFIATFAMSFFFVAASNTLIFIANTTVFAPIANAFPMTLWLVQNLPFVCMAISLLIIFAGLGKEATTSSLV